MGRARSNISYRTRLQVARVVREGLPGDRRKQNISFMSYVFVTFAGPRLAEPCSVSAVAMHQLLTQVSMAIVSRAIVSTP